MLGVHAYSWDYLGYMSSNNSEDLGNEYDLECEKKPSIIGKISIYLTPYPDRALLLFPDFKSSRYDDGPPSRSAQVH